MKWLSVLFVAVVALLVSTASHAAEKEAAKAAAPVALRTTRIVFIDKENACECTQKKIVASWAALQAANTRKLPVERIHLDTQAEQAQVYRAKKPLVALPAIYFVDAKAEVVERVQGEVTEAQVRGAMK